MRSKPSTEAPFRAENAVLRARLEEAEQTLRAIRSGTADALIVETSEGPQVFTLQGLDAEQNRFRGEMLTQVSDAVVAVDTGGRVTFLNAAAERQYRVRAGDVLGCRLTEVFTRCWPSPEAEAGMQAALSEHGKWRGEMVHRRADGSEFPVEVSLTVLRGADGECTGRISAIRDVAYRIKIQQEKAEALRLLETLLTHAPVGFAFIDRELRFVRINERLAEINGYSVAAHLGRPIAEIIPKLAPALNKMAARILATGQPVLDREFTGETARAPGVARHWNASWYPVHDEHGEIIGFGALVEDITERKRAEAELRLLNERFDLAVKCSKVTLFLQDLELCYRWIHNPVADFDGAEIVGKRDADLMERAEDAAVTEALKGQVIRSGVGMQQEVLIHIRNAARYFDLIVEPVQDAAGLISGVTCAAIDITERKKAEQAHVLLERQLQESQKMEAIGTLAAGIAHDFNNIIGTILVNAELARRDAAANHQALVSLGEIEKAGHHAKELVQQIVSFSRRMPTLHQVVSLCSVVEESMQLLRTTLPGGIRLEYRCAGDTPSVLADPTQVTQVLLNLVTNAAQAIGGRPGSIDIRVEGITLDETSVRLDLNLRSGRYARIVVSDTGPGMDAATRRRIFDPFFTTKPAGEGTGLGLSVVHSIMQAHQGVIVVQSAPGRGSAFELYFPCADDSAAALGTTEAAGPTSEGRGRHILYIEDDEGQLFASKRMLERWGYRVSAYLEQREALDAVLAGKLRFDLVVTDFNMPGATGLEIARAIHNALPDLPVIMISGYITDALRAQAESAGVRQLIAKPQDLEELRDAVQSIFFLPTETPDRNQP
jgi:two-component system, cell cycle sensor histidine kinase and response regulator CckA